MGEFLKKRCAEESFVAVLKLIHLMSLHFQMEVLF